MSIYHVKRTDTGYGYDQYDSAVVCADSPEDAKEICDHYFPPKVAKVTLVGVASADCKRGVVLDSYNA